MALTRTAHWATRELHDFLRARAQSPFVWGKTDCALFAADGILAMTGVDIAAEFRNRYSDAGGAKAAISEVCGGQTVADAAAWCAKRHGLPEWKYPLYARRGDLVVIDNAGEGLIAGLVHLNGRHAVSQGANGLLRLPLKSILRAWHVGPPQHTGGLGV